MHSISVLAVASAFFLSACGPGGDDPFNGEAECESALLVGDLVITEVMANPEGDDDGNEYFEIYNATSAAIDLTGLVLEYAAVDGSKDKEHVMRGTIIEAGSYIAVGGVLDEFRAPYIAYGYADDLGGMTNGGGQLGLRCKDVQVDHLVYGEAVSGHSQGLDGNIVPDHLSNDLVENFCPATTEFATEAFGSPGVGNEPCSILEQTTCLDKGTARDVVKPEVGDLVFTEFMPNPDSVGDEVGEWFELTATGNFDLNGLVAGNDPASPKINIVDENCLAVSINDRLLFARSTDSAANGGLPAPDYTFSFGLSNGGATLFVGTTVDEAVAVIDTITWTSSGTGESTSLDPALLSAAANDDEANWCEGKTAYGTGDLGSPGEPNLPCDTSGMCMDGDSLRATNPPLAADVRITEYMPNPAVISDTNGEWFEVHFAAGADLNGLQLGKESVPALIVSTTIDSVDCVIVEADTHVVFARKTDTAVNGGLPTENILASGISLGQTSSADFNIFVAIENVLLDSVNYVGGDTTSGVARQIDGTDAVCDATVPYGTGDNLGTPGSDNGSCP
ncbi:MAG: lamin tail domain-containing protein [Myxococcales bacterium]|nr:lamin tail domain-containing protein [Myxococcales bacterium]